MIDANEYRSPVYDLAGKRMLVTGAAGDIGRAALRRLSESGAHVFAVDWRSNELENTVGALRTRGLSVEGLVGDVTIEADVKRVYRDASRSGEVHGLVNSAGIEGEYHPFEQYPVDVFDRVLAVNVRGVFLAMKHLIPLLRAGGAIVNVASTAGLVATPGWSAYIASKHAVIGLTRAAAVETARRGIRVNAICPGPIEGRMIRSVEEATADLHNIPQGNAAAPPLGRPSEVAELAIFLLSSAASHITGGIYTIDGGITAGPG